MIRCPARQLPNLFCCANRKDCTTLKRALYLLPGRSEIIRVDEIGVKVCRVLNEHNQLVGVFTMKTIGGGKFSRIIVRIGRVRSKLKEDDLKSSIADDASEFQEVHARVKIAQLQLTLWGDEGDDSSNLSERRRRGERRQKQQEKKLVDPASDLFSLPSPPSNGDGQPPKPNPAYQTEDENPKKTQYCERL